MLSLVDTIVFVTMSVAVLLTMFDDEAWYYAAVISGGFVFFAWQGLWEHHPLAAGVELGVALLWALIAWLEWKNRKRRKRRRLLSALGYKGRAVLRKMAKSMPRVRVPRLRVPAPVPG